MLTRPHRLTSGREFAAAIRRGRRAGTRTMVLHLLAPETAAGVDQSLDQSGLTARPRPVQVGFVVGRSVGSAVTRNLVKRRLRALARERLASLPRSSTLVVRALPPAAGASYAALGADMDRALARTRSPRPPKRNIA